MESPATVRQEPAASDRPHGCLTAFVLGVLLSIAGCGGIVWLLSISEMLTQISGATFTLDVIRAVGYGLLLIIPCGLAAIFLKRPGFELWRGIALMAATFGGFALIAGIMLALDRSLDYPGLPDALLPAFATLYAVAIIAAARRLFLGRPIAWLAALGLALGLIVTAAWANLGALGTPTELLQAVFDGLSYGLLSAALVTLAFVYDEGYAERHRLWAALLIGASFVAILFALMAVRGWSVQGSLIATSLIFAGWIGGMLMALPPGQPLRRTWWAGFAGLFMAFFIPFAFTEGVEGEYMLDEYIPVWGNAATTSVGISLVALAALVAGQIITRRMSAAWMPRVRGILAAAALAAALLITSAAYATGQPGLQPETFFVVMADQADTSFAREIADRDERVSAVYKELTEHAEETQADLQAYLDEQGADYTPYYLVNGIEVRGTVLLRWQISMRQDVARILRSPDDRALPRGSKPIPMMPDEGRESGQLSAGVDAIDAERVWQEYGITGEGIIVGEADSGVDWTHPALRSRYMGSADQHDYTWLDPWQGTTEPTDTGGHGTHTLGIVLGQDGIGVAPGARWIGCRNLARNLGNPAYYLDCMQFLFAPYPQDGDPFVDGDPTRGAHITNNSWGCPPEEGCDPITLNIAVEHLRNAGQMFVVSAGNDGPACDTVGPPANADAAFSVGSVNPFSDELSIFSSRGPILNDGSGRIKPDVAAPGEAILSSVPGGGYAEAEGTSMAGPHVTGVAALLWSADPSLIGDIDRTEQIIIETATHESAPDPCGNGTPDHNNEYGYGIVNAYEAVRAVMGQ